MVEDPERTPRGPVSVRPWGSPAGPATRAAGRAPHPTTPGVRDLATDEAAAVHRGPCPGCPTWSHHLEHERNLRG